MTTTPVRVVYDCVVFLQGAGRRGNAARECPNLVDTGIVQLCLSAAVLKEIEDVLNRPELLQKFPLIKSEDSQVLLRTVRNKSLLLTDVPNVFTLPRDPDDEPYTDLAIAANAAFLAARAVTPNRPLTHQLQTHLGSAIPPASPPLQDDWVHE